MASRPLVAALPTARAVRRFGLDLRLVDHPFGVGEDGVAISAPTGLAIRKAEEAGLTLIALARSDGHTIFTHPERVVEV